MDSHSTQKDHRPYTVALTGGIASGKTLVSDEFARLGVAVIDTDVIAHKIVEPGQPALQEIKNIFGSGIIDTNGRLKRANLKQIIFSDAFERKKLESILHPKIRREVSKSIKKVSSAYCVLVIPLLNTRCAYPNLDRILVVDVEPETQISRLMARDKSSRKQAEQALASQETREQRLRNADDILDNSALPNDIIGPVALLHRKYTRFAKKVKANIDTA